MVDDLPANIGNLFGLLHGTYQVKTALSGNKALECVYSPEPPDLILLDCMMPGMTGYQVCERLKADPETAHIPIVFVTSLDSEEDEEKGLRLGAVDYIIKPFRPAIVLARVENHLKLKDYQDLLRSQSRLDGLTGLANRRAFDELLSREWRRGLRLGSPLSVILLDIDHFKAYNDSYGHLAGDDCLRNVADALADAVRSTDFVSRYGGEEFACVLPHTDGQGAKEVAEKLRKAIETLAIPHQMSQVCGHVSISLGVASACPQLHQEPEELLNLADQMLYRAKDIGRNAVCEAGLELEQTFGSTDL